jgi:hypothetical protein
LASARSTWPSIFYSRHRCCSSPLVRSLVPLFPSHHSHRTLAMSIRSERRLSSLPVTAESSPTRVTTENEATRYSLQVRSSPAHPRSRQAPFPVSRPSQKAPSALPDSILRQLSDNQRGANADISVGGINHKRRRPNIAWPVIILGTQLKPAGARLSDHMSIQVAGRSGRDVSAKTRAGDSASVKEKAVFCRSPAVSGVRRQ